MRRSRRNHDDDYGTKETCVSPTNVKMRFMELSKVIQAVKLYYGVVVKTISVLIIF